MANTTISINLDRGFIWEVLSSDPDVVVVVKCLDYSIYFKPLIKSGDEANAQIEEDVDLAEACGLNQFQARAVVDTLKNQNH